MGLTSLTNAARSHLFGYDIFISYTRADAKEYAAKLYEQLTSLDYSCFFDKKEAPGGSSLNSALRSALAGSKTLVLVATEKALSREYVRLEFGEFAAKRRIIIPINVDSALTEEKLKEGPWSVIKERDLIWLDETAESLKSGLPSPEVYEGIQNLFKFTRRNVTRRRWTTGAAFLILGVAALALWQAKDARAQKLLADEQRAIAVEQRAIAERQTQDLLANKARLQEANDLVRAKVEELQKSQAELEAKSKEAVESAGKAREQEALARASAREAETQQKLAQEKALLAEEQLARNRALLYDSDMSLAYGAQENGNADRVRELLTSYTPGEKRQDFEDPRGFEWYHLLHIARKKPTTLGGHSTPVTAVAFSPDGRTLATAGGKELKLWDAAAPTEPRTLDVGESLQHSVAFSPDGKWLAHLSGKRVSVWDARAQAEPKVFEVPFFSNASLAFAPDGKTLAVATHESVSLLDVAGGKSETLPCLETDCNSVAFAPDGKTLAAGGQNGVQLWDTGAKPWEKLPSLKVKSNFRGAIAFSPAGNLFAAADEGAVKLWDTSTSPWSEKEFEKACAGRRGHTDFILSLAFSPDGKTLASGSADKTAKLWDTTTGEELKTPAMRHPNYVFAVALSPDGRTLATGSADKNARLWDIAWREDEVPLTASDTVSCAALSPDGRTLAVGTYNKSLVELWDTAARRRFKTLSKHTSAISSLAFSPDGGTLVVASADKAVTLWDAATWTEKTEKEASLQLPPGATPLGFSPDGTVAAVNSQTEELRLWDVKAKRWLPRLEGAPTHIEHVALSSDGKLAVAGGFLKLWDLKTGRVLRTLAEQGYASPIAFSPDGKTLAAIEGFSVTLWDAEAGQKAGALKGHSSYVRSLTFSPDGKTLATSALDKSVRLWSPETRQEVATIQVNHVSASPAFSRDGGLLAVPVYDGVLLWRAATSREIEVFRGETGADTEQSQ